MRSTKTKNKTEARLIAAAWETAEKEAARGSLTRERLEAILEDTLIRLGHPVKEHISVKQWLEEWLAAKK
jgi:hypothetical protein